MNVEMHASAIDEQNDETFQEKGYDMSRSNNPPLTPERFDAMMAGHGKVWGLANIANQLGVSVDKARRFATHTDCPIYRPDGESYFAFRSELISWLKTKR
ncbi:DNA-binding protein [Roseovarius pacificus]|uniref:DNA-binding protein n=1 Tax=Roseovarius pacificus TaxID=337701 RepID=UPI002A187A85|nr:DNA-binding protein [Roseovarius pacificus]